MAAILLYIYGTKVAQVAIPRIDREEPKEMNWMSLHTDGIRNEHNINKLVEILTRKKS